MKVIIPAAGYATRLYPLTYNTPKQLLDVGDKKMIEHILDRLEEIEDIDHIYIVTNDKFHEHFLKWESTYSHLKPITILNNGTKSNEERLGAIGDMYHVVKECSIYDDVFIIGGDNLFEFNISDMIEFTKNKDGSSIAIRDLKDKALLANKYGVVEIDADHKIIGFEEKPDNPKTSLTATMVYIIKKDHLKELHNIMKEGAPDNAGEFIKYLSERQDVYGYIFEEAWYDIGSHEELENVNNIYGGE